MPFKPSGAVNAQLSPTSSPTRTNYYYLHSKKGSKLLTPSNEQLIPRPKTTEYNDKFIEWELPDKKSMSPPKQRTSLMNSFDVAQVASSWESEQHRSFNNLTNALEGRTHRTSGKPAKDPRLPVSSFAWDNPVYEKRGGN